ncbi:MAG: CDP-alcohol phosphatidyltransferase [Pseudonocardiaceae bacterium]|nr:CDP-alcohol phosphatidyltransferase [Pseudonocardiaceae bacterium]
MTERAADDGFAAALRALPSAQKTTKGAPAYSRFVNRRAGGYLAAAAYQLGMTPNQVTAISAVFTFTGIVAIPLIQPSFWLGLGVCLALLIGYALDAADGQLARLRGGGSRSGEWLDHIVDSAKISALHLTVLISWYRFFDLPIGYLLIPIGFQVVAAVMFFAMTLNDQLRRARRANVPATNKAAQPASTLRSLIVVPTDYGVLCLAFLTFGFTSVFPVIYGLLFLTNLVFLAAALRKWFNDMAELDAPADEKTSK